MAGSSGFALGLIGIGAGLAVGIAGLSGIGQGIAAASGIGSVAEKEEVFGRGMVFSVLPETQAIYGMLIAILLMIFSGLLGDPVLVGETQEIQMFIGLVGVGAGLSVGVAGLSGIGQGIAAGSGIATVAEDEQMFGRGMVFSVLPETQAIYGMLIAILLMVFSGMLGGVYPEGAGVQMGIAAVGAGLAIGIAGVSGVGQGITSGSAIAAVSKREETFGKGMIFSVMSETFAIFGLLIAIFIIVFLGFM
ncbi:MAG: V-type ATP synthase subunit K [Candidatus Thermoplasmatota archaeon]